MREVTADLLMSIAANPQPPCVSLYQPTHRSHPDNRQDPIRYRNLVRRIEATLKELYPQAQSIVDRYRAFEEDEAFWNGRTEGLAMLASPERFEVFELQRPVPERLIVADSFHVKPLLRILQSADRYQILGLTRTEVKLYEGNRDALDRVDLTDVPATLEEALGEELTARQPVRAAPGVPAVARAAGQRTDEIKIDTERFFRTIDRAILEHHSRPSGLPLLLAALPEHQGEFRALSRNPYLVPRGIEIDPNALDLEALRQRAWEQVEPMYLERLASLVDAYEAARARQLGAEDLADIGRAAVAGRVGTLLVEAERVVPGRLDPTSGAIERSRDGEEGAADDLLDDLAEAVLRTKGEVIVVPAERMPTRTGAAATYRY